MSEKMKLPKAVCDALDVLKKNNQLKNALIFGYEPELTAEEQIKKDFFSIHCTNSEHDYGYRQGIRSALRIHGIHYDWLDGDAE